MRFHFPDFTFRITYYIFSIRNLNFELRDFLFFSKMLM